MHTRRDRISQWADFVGALQPLGSMRSAYVNDLRVLAYHRVLPDHFDDATFRFDTELVSATETEFDWQMTYVAKHFEPVSCQQVIDAIDNGAPLPKRAIMVTFDDGYLDNYEVAYPVMRRHGIPGLFFITTGYINSDRIFWFDWLVHTVLHSTESQVRLNALDLTLHLQPSTTSRRLVATQLLRRLKRTPEAHRLRILQQLNDATGVQIEPADLEQSKIMTWAQVQEMSSAGMEFGSHTVSHPILSTVTEPYLLRMELEDSKAKIEEKIALPVTALAYPVGGRDAVNPDVLAATEKAGYKLAFTYQSGTSKPCVAERYLLKRIHVERYTTRHMFTAALELPELFA
jgi:peptidoglycan/xylan/chitin deacetylase (PgdA/CDA1 family)